MAGADMSKGNQGRRGAQRRDGRKEGTGGGPRRALAGKGPTPKAEDRTYHAAHRKKKAADKRRADAEARAKGQMKTRVRVQQGNELVVGRNAVAEAVNSGIKVERIFLSADPGDGRMREIVGILANTGAPFVEVTRRDLDIASDDAVHQGIGIEVPEYEYYDLDEVLVKSLSGNSLLVAMDHVTDPHNLGAVLRSSAAFGVDGVIVPERRAAGVGVTAWKVSAGAAAKVPVTRVNNLVQALQRCKDAGFFIVGLEGEAQHDIRSFPLAADPLVLVTGAEGKGLSRLVANACDMLVSIPIDGMESLNAAVATGIALYEVSAQRKPHPA